MTLGNGRLRVLHAVQGQEGSTPTWLFGCGYLGEGFSRPYPPPMIINRGEAALQNKRSASRNRTETGLWQGVASYQ